MLILPVLLEGRGSCGAVTSFTSEYRKLVDRNRGSGVAYLLWENTILAKLTRSINLLLFAGHVGTCRWRLKGLLPFDTPDKADIATRVLFVVAHYELIYWTSVWVSSSLCSLTANDLSTVEFSS